MYTIHSSLRAVPFKVKQLRSFLLPVAVLLLSHLSLFSVHTNNCVTAVQKEQLAHDIHLPTLVQRGGHM